MLPDCVILAGGFGTRLRSVVSDRSKVIAPVRGRPFLTYVLDAVVAGGGRRVVLAVGYLAEGVREAIGSRYGPLEIAYAVESSPLGTGGALANAAAHVRTPDVVVLNGDSIILEDLAFVARRHSTRRPGVTLVAVEVPDTAAYGAVVIDTRGKVAGFLEKGRPGPGMISAGVYVMRTEVVAGLPVPSSLERDVLPGLVRSGEVDGFVSTAPFIDVGTPDAYARLEAEAEVFLRAPGMGPHS